jgi:hypothetical protein
MGKLRKGDHVKIGKLEDLPADKRDAILAASKRHIRRQTAPYLRYAKENHERARRLGNIYLERLRKYGLVKTARDGSEDILRAVVVFTHASLEDFLRTLAETFLPYANEQTLSNIPLAGTNMSRADKFSLGTLQKHKGKRIDRLIEESVSEHLKRSTYNNAREIASLLVSLGFDLAEPKKHFPEIEAMIQRRHEIVHRGDIRTGTDPKRPLVKPISFVQVVQWVQTTYEFMFDLSSQIYWKKFDLQMKEVLARNARHQSN